GRMGAKGFVSYRVAPPPSCTWRARKSAVSLAGVGLFRGGLWGRTPLRKLTAARPKCADLLPLSHLETVPAWEAKRWPKYGRNRVKARGRPCQTRDRRGWPAHASAGTLRRHGDNYNHPPGLRPPNPAVPGLAARPARPAVRRLRRAVALVHPRAGRL